MFRDRLRSTTNDPKPWKVCMMQNLFSILGSLHSLVASEVFCRNVSSFKCLHHKMECSLFTAWFQFTFVITHLFIANLTEIIAHPIVITSTYDIPGPEYGSHFRSLTTTNINTQTPYLLPQASVWISRPVARLSCRRGYTFPT